LQEEKLYGTVGISGKPGLNAQDIMLFGDYVTIAKMFENV